MQLTIKRRRLAGILALIFLSVTMRAQTRQPAVSSGKYYAKMITATVQRTLPGREAPPTEQMRLIVLWKSLKAPETFYWRGKDGWMTCLVSRVHQGPGSREYETEQIGPEGVKKGDTIELTPLAGGKFAIPGAIRASGRHNALFFKAKRTNWQYLQVTTFTRRPDIIMP